MKKSKWFIYILQSENYCFNIYSIIPYEIERVNGRRGEEADVVWLRLGQPYEHDINAVSKNSNIHKI